VIRRLLARLRGLIADCEPDRRALSRRYRLVFGRPLDLRNPRTFNEKLFWLILYYRTPLVTQLADKYEVRRYVAERLGPQFLNDLYGVWDSVDQIDPDRLPDAFVLKVNWGWKMNILCPSKATFDWNDATSKVTAWMKRSHYWYAREWCYKNIKPRIICERYLLDRSSCIPSDYKFFCFGGEPRFVQVHSDRFGQHTRDILDLDWKKAPFGYLSPPSDRPVARPENLEEMIRAARTLASGFPFVRVDFYSLDGRTIFGEMTWYPSAGAGRFLPEEYAVYWGDALPLPTRRQI
jgi:hypothetical protein